MNVQGSFDNIFIRQMEKVNQINENQIEKLNSMIQKAEDRNKSFFERKKSIDIALYINLALTPVLLIIILWLNIKK